MASDPSKLTICPDPYDVQREFDTALFPPYQIYYYYVNHGHDDYIQHAWSFSRVYIANSHLKLSNSSLH